MVSTDEHLSVNLFESLNRLAYALINSLNSLDCCCLNTSMSNHIRVREVDDDHVVFLRFNCCYKLLTNLWSAHLRLKVIGRNLRGLHKDSVLALVWLLNATVEEEGYVSIFLCLSDTCLSHVVSCKVLAECVMKLNLVECNQLVSDGVIVICEAHICEVKAFLSCKACKFVIAECSCDLTCTVRTEVEEYNRVLVRNNSNWFAIFLNDCWKNELVCLAIVIGCLYSLSCIGSLNALALGKCVVSKLNTIPAVVTVHCVITSGNNTNLTYAKLIHLCLKLLDISFSGCRRCVTAVKEAVYVNFLKSFILRHLKKSEKMGDVAVNTSIRKKSHKMNCRIIFFGILHCCKKCLILKEITVLDLFGDSGKLLVYDTACAHVHMSYLRVTHLALWKTYSQSACVTFYKRILSHQLVHDRGICFINSVSVMSVIQAVSIKNH